MKYLWIVIVTGIINYYPATAQTALLDRAYDFIQQGELRKAESAILIAEKNVTTANDARTYYLKAFVYKDLFNTATGAERNQLRKTSWSSVLRTELLDHDKSFKQPVKQLKDFISASVYNDGTEDFNQQRYVSSIEHFQFFKKTAMVQDTYWLDANYFIGSAYYNLEQQDSARHYLQLVKDRNYDQPALFTDLAYIYFSDKNKIKAFAILEEGLQLYPAYFDLQIAQLNILAGFEQDSLLEIKAEEFLKKNPDNIDVLLMLGTTYEKNRKEEKHPGYFAKAEVVYKKVIELQPDNFDGNYNLGVLYYNEAVDIVNKTELDTDVDELTKVLEKSTRLFEKALPLLLNIYESANNNLKLLQALQAIYYNLNMKHELIEINAIIKKTSL